MEPIRILQIVPNMQAGGLETFIMNVYRSIDRSKIQFDFLVHYKKHCYYDDEIQQLGGRIYRCSVREDHNLFKYLGELNSFFKNHPEFKIVHGHMESLGIFYFLTAKRYGVKTRICHSHNTATDPTIHGLLKRMLGRAVKYCANIRFACSADAGGYLFGKKSFVIIPNAVDTQKFSFHPAIRNQLRWELHLEDKLVIGHVGRFESQKNHEFILKIFVELQKKCPDASLILIGTGVLLPKIEEMVRDLGLQNHVNFMGIRTDVNELYQAMDGFILPSLYEGFPVVTVEAQCAGLPVVVSDSVTSAARLTKHFYQVSLKQNAAVWAEQILKACDGAERNKPSEMMDARFDIRTVAEELTAFYLSQYRG